MALYRVIRGFHYVGNRVLKAGDTFEVPCEDYECGTVFEKAAPTGSPTEPPKAPEAPEATRPDRRKKKR